MLFSVCVMNTRRLWDRVVYQFNIFALFVSLLYYFFVPSTIPSIDIGHITQLKVSNHLMASPEEFAKSVFLTDLPYEDTALWKVANLILIKKSHSQTGWHARVLSTNCTARLCLNLGPPSYYHVNLSNTQRSPNLSIAMIDITLIEAFFTFIKGFPLFIGKC